MSTPVAFIRIRRSHAELKEAPQINYIRRILIFTPIINLNIPFPDNTSACYKAEIHLDPLLNIVKLPSTDRDNSYLN